VEHLQHFGLVRDPFCNEPIPDQFLEIGPHREALLRLGRAVHQRKGLCVVTGEVGSGKTMALRQLFENLEEEMFEASLMVVLNAGADAAWIMTRFARQLGIEEPAAEREALLVQVYEQLAIVREDGRHTVLLIDDAEVLAHGPTLVDVCGLLKLEYEDRRLLTLVLAGGPPLAQALGAVPGLAARVEVKVTLGALGRAAAHDYLGRRLQAAGSGEAILDEDAMAAIHELGTGLPGRMNTLADNALFEAFLASRGQVTRTDVERAHRDLAWTAPAAAPAAVPPPVAAPAPQPEPSPLAARPLPPLDPLGESGTGFGEGDVLPPASGGGFDQLDTELDAAFAIGPDAGASSPGDTLAGARFADSLPSEGPPKEDDDVVDDLLVELIEE
jgi:general secretion pathway protein A